MSDRKKFWIYFVISSFVACGVGVALYDWMAAVLLVFVVLVLFINIAFNKKNPALAGAYGGLVTGLGVSLLFIFFGPVQFYA
ncbi:hypothetical protein [Teredinibacter turnerae]|uniref:hypothetical protein n=1 Tax=Teredinibacter turnerae TaxID=2426 RepID=UPI00048B5197|nr:hypothetical protein [Teredinibacter turnerae]